jgi:hypothetical protein
MDKSWDNQPTVTFQTRMKPAALRIYQRCFPGCTVEDLREQGVKVHILDKEFGIDSLIHFPSGQWLSIQEKYRTNKYLRYGEFTQEYLNGVGTVHESPGEWFKLGAQIYFYGWANADETDFAAWLMMHIARYKVVVERAGGLGAVGTLHQNQQYGRASFYAIPIGKLRDCIMFSYGLPPLSA